ncbi:MAG: phosphoglycerate dehydrogenase [Eubacteriales bacterium]|nr:phosphoglycerate dehydrogenase [Clostridiales bacterium]
MKRIKLLNKIAEVGTNIFDRTKYEVSDSVEDPHAIMVRSANMHDYTYGPSLYAIARAGAGVNNIPLDRCAEAGIVVFNTPGANAIAVKELAIAALILASRNIIDGIEWLKTITDDDISAAVEKGKSRFAGVEISGKTLGIIGLGAIGGMVANAAHSLDMNVIGCDPYISIEGAWRLSRSVSRAASYDEIYEKSDYITLHVPATKETKNMINAESIAKMKDGVRIINLARGDLVDSDAMIAALDSGKVACYVTDFVDRKLLGHKGVIATPHLGASTAESEDNCAVMAAKHLIEYLELGNIKNSVNYPNVSLPHTGDFRICILHRNVPAVLSKISTVISSGNFNIENMVNGSRGDYAYTLVEINGALPKEYIDKIEDINNVFRVRVIE